LDVLSKLPTSLSLASDTGARALPNSRTSAYAAASVAVKLFVAVTAFSSPAFATIRNSERLARLLPSEFVNPMVRIPASLADSTAARTSILSPDCDKATTAVPVRSLCLTQEENSDAGKVVEAILVRVESAKFAAKQAW
jgi:hypothetical protein